MSSIPTSGIGSWPGDDISEAARQVIDLVSLPYVPELPSRGPGSDMVGRALGLIDGIGFELSPTGWRVSDHVSPQQRRARARLMDDLDVVTERLESHTGPLKVALCGWWTLAAAVDLPRGGRVLGDSGAVRDLVQAGQQAVAGLGAAVRSRLPDADVRLQLDEPALPMVLAGGVPTESGLRRFRPVDPEQVGRSLQHLPERTVVHCCGADVPVALLRRAGVADVSLDGGLLTTAGWDAVAEHVDAGGTLWLGLLPTDVPSVPSPDQLVTRALGWLRPLELGPRLLDSLVLTPACGLTHVGVREAVAASESLARAADLLADELLR